MSPTTVKRRPRNDTFRTWTLQKRPISEMKPVFLWKNQKNVKLRGKTGQKCRKAGVDILVAGSYIFNSDNYLEKVELLNK